MTLDEAIVAAGQLLEQRGQLLNGHLLRLVDGDKELFRDVREQLIASGIAEDRSGVGLARLERSEDLRSKFGSFENPPGTSSLGASSGATPDRQSAALRSTVAEWWLMSSGTPRGPFTLATLCQMRGEGELKPADVVRCGTEGRWTQPDEVADLAAVRPAKNQRPNSFRIGDRLAAERQFSGGNSSQAIRGSGHLESIRPRTEISANERSVSALPPNADADVEDDVGMLQVDRESIDDGRFVPPDKIWSLGNQRTPGRLNRGWNLAADLVGGSNRLKAILLVFTTVGLFIYWWRQPPPARTIYNEFTACRAAILKLQDRRAKRSEWVPVVERYRPRVQFMVDRLRNRASDRYPLQRALHSAGSIGLLPLLDNPMDPTSAERAFDQYMGAARELLEGNGLRNARNAPAK